MSELCVVLFSMQTKLDVDDETAKYFNIVNLFEILGLIQRHAHELTS